VCGVCRQLSAACGAEATIESVLPHRPNVVGRFASDKKGKPRLLFAPHTDTVSVAGMTIDPFAAPVREGKVWGRGATDTKGSMAAMLMALRESRELLPKLSHEIWFAGLMGEEGGADIRECFSPAQICSAHYIGRVGFIWGSDTDCWEHFSGSSTSHACDFPDADSAQLAGQQR